MGLGEAYALSSAITWALSVVLFTRLVSQTSALALNYSKNIIGFFLLLSTHIALEGLIFPAMSLQNWLILIMSGVIGMGLADTLYIYTLKHLGAAHTGVIAMLYSPFVVVLSIVFLGEILSIFQYIGIIIVLSGISFVTLSQSRKDHQKPKSNIGIYTGVSAILCIALSIVIIKPILEKESFFWIASIRMLTGVIGLTIFILMQKRMATIKNEIINSGNFLFIVAAGILSAYVSYILWLLGFKHTYASIASILNEMNTFFIFIFAWIILKEPIPAKVITGATVALVGILLTVLFELTSIKRSSSLSS